MTPIEMGKYILPKNREKSGNGSGQAIASESVVEHLETSEMALASTRKFD
jgi:hypothetical protein